MKITITVFEKNPIHLGMRVFINGGLSGTLVLRVEEYKAFINRVKPDKVRDETTE